TQHGLQRRHFCQEGRQSPDRAQPASPANSQLAQRNPELANAQVSVSSSSLAKLCSFWCLPIGHDRQIADLRARHHFLADSLYLLRGESPAKSSFSLCQGLHYLFIPPTTRTRTTTIVKRFVCSLVKCHCELINVDTSIREPRSFSLREDMMLWWLDDSYSLSC